MNKNMWLKFLLLTSLLWLPGRCQDNQTITRTQDSYMNSSGHNPCVEHITSPRHKLLAIFSITVLFIGILGNLLTIFIIQSSRRLRRQIAYIYVTSLAVADLGVSLFVTTIKVSLYLRNGSFCDGFELCVFYHVTDSLFPMTSISHLVIIGVDRWYAIACPYAYVSNMTTGRAKYHIVGVWAYSMIWTVMGTFSWEQPDKMAYGLRTFGQERLCFSLNKYYHTTIVSVIYILPMTVITCLYVVVLYIAMKQAVAISKTNVADRKIRKRRLNTDMKAAKTVAAVFLAYTVCWLPHIVVVIIQYWLPGELDRFYLWSSTIYDVVTTIISNILPTISSCVNPFIYFLVGAQFRMAFNDFYRKLMRLPSNELVSHGNNNNGVHTHVHKSSSGSDSESKYMYSEIYSSSNGHANGMNGHCEQTAL